ncbi:carbon storage regulator CsrA [Geobacter sp.]|uniref:carbon storage regulator CsrA n=1 Tax=Geobacter sp. TaxID=46610 RepID=UPI0026251852|nr:carbon storage regulator CsrA [Geobacter sp.]
MLVLTRKMGEVVTIGDQIRIKVVEMKGNQVRLGIEAPGEMRIYREEIFLKVQRENQLAAEWNLTDLETAVTYLAAGNKE